MPAALAAPPEPADPADDPAATLARLFETTYRLAGPEAAALARRCRLRTLADADIIVREGEPATAVHWIVAGQAMVCRDTADEGRLALLALGPGAVIGEIAFLRDDADAAYSATVVAEAGTLCAAIDHAALRGEPALQAAAARLADRFGRIAADRLSATTAFTAESMSAAIAHERRLARHLSMVIMVMAGFVVLSNSRAELARQMALGEAAFVSLFYVVFDGLLGVLFYGLLRALGEPPEALGLRRAGLGRQAAAGVLWSLPALAAAAAARAWLYPGEPVLSVHALAAGGTLLSGPVVALFLAYLLVLCPVQEYVARAGVQAPILRAFGASRARLGTVVSSLVAAVTFGAMHIAYGLMPVLLTTAIGLYWGAVFVRTRSVVAVSVSHMLLGTAAFYWFGLIR